MSYPEIQPDSELTPTWLPAASVPAAQRPAAEWAWLTETGSLTGRVRRHCVGRFALRVLGEASHRLTDADTDFLGLFAPQSGLVREVELTCDGRPWVYACSVIPDVTLAAYPELARLGERPLGDSVFGERGGRRGEIEVAALAPPMPLYLRAVNRVKRPPAILWARRSVIRLADNPVLVCECFLPRTGQSRATG
ncbi:MAG: chorismate lyase [Gammaproteobacteria bacterium]